jgi:hypothetical protein
MLDCKSAPMPFLSGVKLSAKCSTPLVDATLYRQLVGNLLYLTHNHPDISYAVGLVSRFMQEPHELHWKDAKRILRYIRGTHTYGIHYSSYGNTNLVGYTDSDWVGDLDDRKSTSGYVFHLGSGPIAWSSKKQASITLSSTEAEYRGVVNASTESIWIRQILSELSFQQEQPTLIWCDNQSVIHISKEPVEHQRTKHIEVHMHYIRQLIHDKIIDLQYCRTELQVADIFTKPLTKTRYVQLRTLLGVKEVDLRGGSLCPPSFFLSTDMSILYMGTYHGLVVGTHFLDFSPFL